MIVTYADENKIVYIEIAAGEKVQESKNGRYFILVTFVLVNGERVYDEKFTDIKEKC